MSSVGSRRSRFDFSAGRFLESAETSTVIVRVSRLVACLYHTPGSPRKAFCILATITYSRHNCHTLRSCTPRSFQPSR